MVTASHTHCGPALGGNLEVMFDLDAEQARRGSEYTEALPGKMAEAVARAVADLGEATLEWTLSEAGFAVYRRQYTLGGVVLGLSSSRMRRPPGVVFRCSRSSWPVAVSTRERSSPWS